MTKRKAFHNLITAMFGVLLNATVFSNVCLATPESEQEEQARIQQRYQEADDPGPGEAAEAERIQQRYQEAGG